MFPKGIKNLQEFVVKIKVTKKNMEYGMWNMDCWKVFTFTCYNVSICRIEGLVFKTMHVSIVIMNKSPKKRKILDAREVLPTKLRVIGCIPLN